MNAQEIYKQRIEEASIEYTMKTRPMCIAGDAFADMAIEINKNPHFISGANFALQNQWISVEEALPEKMKDKNYSKYVLARQEYYEHEYHVIARYDYNFKMWVSTTYFKPEFITHWMPIPILEGGEK